MNETREAAGAAMYQAIPCLAWGIASSRAEVTSSCSQKNSQREFFCEQEKRSTMLPQANQAFIG
jgi:hypothetical protein